MSAAPNATHDPTLRSWVTSADAADCDFPLQNLPFAIFRRAGTDELWRGGVAIGDQILDLQALNAARPFAGIAAQALAAGAEPTLNRLMALGPPAWSGLRASLSRLLRSDVSAAARAAAQLVPQAQAEFALPARIGDYTDFYASIHHATAVGRLLRPSQPLMPNYKWMPIAYHGRASSVGVSGQAFARPWGQSLPSGATAPVFGPSRRLDYELEVGLFVGTGNALGMRVPLAEAEAKIFGLCLLNDWSARDLQGWEYQPLGPFLGKNFATTISPWIVTLEALAPFRSAWARPAADPEPLAYLEDPLVRASGAFDITLEVSLESARMRAAGIAPQRLSQTSFRHCYWTPAHMVAHHTVNGCNLEPGDLLGSGAQSGPAAPEAGSLLELTAGGAHEIALAGDERRRFLEDGDRVVLTGWCERLGSTRIGLGSAAALILPAHSSDT
jgi:fumarylacetoacetase